MEERERWSQQRVVPGTAASLLCCCYIDTSVLRWHVTFHIYASLTRFSFVLLFNQNLSFLINKETQIQSVENRLTLPVAARDQDWQWREALCVVLRKFCLVLIQLAAIHSPQSTAASNDNNLETKKTSFNALSSGGEFSLTDVQYIYIPAHLILSIPCLWGVGTGTGGAPMGVVRPTRPDPSRGEDVAAA